MPRKQKKKSTNRKETAIPPPACKALILLNATPIRKKAVTAWKRSRSAYTKAEKELEIYHQLDQPAYTRWVHTKHGQLISENNEIHSKIEFNRTLLQQTSFLSNMTGRNVFECFDEVLDQMEHPEKYQSENDEFSSFFDDMFSDEDDDCDDDDFFSAFVRDYEQMINELDGLFFGVNPNNSTSERPASRPTAEQQRRTQLKQCYRELALRFHPDTSGSTSPHDRELWHRIQRAYSDEDLDELERLRTHCDMMDGTQVQTIPVSHIMALTHRTRNSLKILRSTIRKARKHSDWGFLKWPKAVQEKKSQLIQRSLKTDQMLLNMQLEHLEDELAYFRKPSPPPTQATQQAATEPPEQTEPQEPPDSWGPLFDFFE